MASVAMNPSKHFVDNVVTLPIHVGSIRSVKVGNEQSGLSFFLKNMECLHEHA